jgi:crotonobetainyl-CoA:carnitine CoA-transferase CaiB-like acyl-CoA transferase
LQIRILVFAFKLNQDIVTPPFRRSDTQASLSVDQVFDDPHVRARGLCVEMPHAMAGKVPLVANPIRMSASPVTYRRAPPTLGEHTGEVLLEWLGADYKRG